MVSLRMTEPEYERYGKMVNYFVGVGGWTGLILKALGELAAAYEGPWSTPMELVYHEHKRQKAKEAEVNGSARGYVLPDDEAIEGIQDEKTKAIFKKKKAAQKSKVDLLKRKKVKPKAR